MDDLVIVVDEHDRELGTQGKVTVHVTGTLHRAFSVVVIDSAGNMLLQRRAATKYHSGGQWSNTCCGHPRPGEHVAVAAARRLREEMGFECALRPVLSFVYNVDVGNGLREHEYDHVFTGRFDGVPTPSPDEASAWKWVSLDAVEADLRAHPECYTRWFMLVLERLPSAESGSPPP